LPSPRVVAARASTSASIDERELLRRSLSEIHGVRIVYASEGNFLLARFEQPQQVFDRLLAAGIVVRDVRAMPRLSDALRISIGTAEENRQLLAAMRQAVSA
jgi:histidinol-phosphate aminotransferase